MNGGLSAENTRLIKENEMKYILLKVLECIDLMKRDCGQKSELLPNKENSIRDRLYYKYLNNDGVMRSVKLERYRFFAEVPEILTSNNFHTQ
jgi:hypothetical protein